MSLETCDLCPFSSNYEWHYWHYERHCNWKKGQNIVNDILNDKKNPALLISQRWLNCWLFECEEYDWLSYCPQRRRQVSHLVWTSGIHRTQVINEASDGIHPVFTTQRRRHHKSQNRNILGSRQRLMSSKYFKKEVIFGSFLFAFCRGPVLVLYSLKDDSYRVIL